MLGTMFLARIVSTDNRFRQNVEDTGSTLNNFRETIHLGTWQRIYLFEHRLQPHVRNIICQLVGKNTYNISITEEKFDIYLYLS